MTQNYPVSNIRSDLFYVLKEVVMATSCEIIKRIITGNAYRKRDYNRYTIGVEGEKRYGVICKVDLQKRDRIVQMINDNLKDGSPFRLTLDEYEQIKSLTRTYLDLRFEQELSARRRRRVRQLVHSAKPHYYNPPEIPM